MATDCHNELHQFLTDHGYLPATGVFDSLGFTAPGPGANRRAMLRLVAGESRSSSRLPVAACDVTRSPG